MKNAEHSPCRPRMSRRPSPPGGRAAACLNAAGTRAMSLVVIIDVSVIVVVVIVIVAAKRRRSAGGAQVAQDLASGAVEDDLAHVGALNRQEPDRGRAACARRRRRHTPALRAGRRRPTAGPAPRSAPRRAPPPRRSGRRGFAAPRRIAPGRPVRSFAVSFGRPTRTVMRDRPPGGESPARRARRRPGSSPGIAAEVNRRHRHHRHRRASRRADGRPDPAARPTRSSSRAVRPAQPRPVPMRRRAPRSASRSRRRYTHSCAASRRHARISTRPSSWSTAMSLPALGLQPRDRRRSGWAVRPRRPRPSARGRRK